MLLLWGSVVMISAPGIRARPNARHIVLILIVALVVRLPLVGSPPLLSDDLYRYLFEGAALNAGHNPFLQAPADLVGFEEALRVEVNHPEVSTVYPPVALWWFRGVALGGSPWVVQAATVMADLVTPAAIAVATRRAWPAWVYALHPLPAIEAAQGAHLDVLGVALAALGVALWRRGALTAAWWSVLAGACAKLLPVVLLPTLLVQLRRRGWTPIALAGLLVASVVSVLLLALPVLDAGPALLTGVQTYADHWSFNGFVFSWVEDWDEPPRRALVLVGAAVGLWAFARSTDPAAVWAVAGAAFVLLSPTVHPWYVLWAMVPALLCERWGWSLAAVPLLASYTVLFAYDPTTGTWSEAPWLWWITWPPAIGALAWTHYRREWMATAPYPAANSSRNGSEAM
ncbi:MAG: hypothetical protein KTR31_13835 [Myxococcales bacterium]|nr:hypothetical protein [Myxococcales bacterium]